MKFCAIRRLALVCVLMVLMAQCIHAQQSQNVYEIKSKYQTITVFDTSTGMRQMIFDAKFDGSDAIQSEMNKKNSLELTLPYSQHMIAAVPVAAGAGTPEGPKRILIVGLAGACIQRYLHKLLPKTLIETVELDPEVLNVARRFFEYKEDDTMKTHIMDGRQFIEESKEKYDLIMLDAFSATSIPYPLSTREFLEACKKNLSDGGVVCANLWYGQADYNDMVKTYDAVFAEFHVIRCPNSTNAILVATPDKRGLTPEKWMAMAAEFEKIHPTELNLPQKIDRGIEQQTRIPTDATVLVDREVWKRN